MLRIYAGFHSPHFLLPRRYIGRAPATPPHVRCDTLYRAWYSSIDYFYDAFDSTIRFFPAFQEIVAFKYPAAIFRHSLHLRYFSPDTLQCEYASHASKFTRACTLLSFPPMILHILQFRSQLFLLWDLDIWYATYLAQWRAPYLLPADYFSRLLSRFCGGISRIP